MKSKKNIKSILIIAIIGIFSLVFFNKSFAANTAKVTVETANIRKEANSTSNILEQVSQNQEVEIIEKSGDWYKIKYKGIQGYLRKDLLSVNGEETANIKEDTTKQEETNQEEKTENTTNVSNTQNTSDTSNTEIVENTSEGVTTNTSVTENVLGTYKVTQNVAVKITPLINSIDIQEISKDSKVNVLEVNNKWALIESNSTRGWVVFSKLSKKENTVAASTTPTEEATNKEETTNKEEQANNQNSQTTEENKSTVTQKNVTMYVNSEVVNLRKEESTSSESLSKLSKATEVTVISESSNGWSKVKVNGIEGYISTKLLSTTKPEVVTSRSLEESRKETEKKEESNKETAQTTTQTAQGSSKGNTVVATAKQYLGCKYVYGGTTPSGFDCSGFTQYVYKQCGVSLNRTSDAQASNGTAVSKSNLQPGDLVIFTGHVGIYIGNNKFIHAANPSKGVITTSLSDSYYTKTYKTARRIFN